MSEHKSGFIAILGRPNAGKSTLMNKITGEKIAAVSSKPQTTRNKIIGILNGEDFQMVFVDTPGVHRPRTHLGEYMNKAAMGAAGEVDAAVLVIDSTKYTGEAEDKIITELKKQGIRTLLVLNKTDAVQKEKLLPLIAQLTAKYEFASVMPVSAKTGDGVQALVDEIYKFLPEGPQFYPDDMITDKTEREIAAECIREKLLRLLSDEVPHGTAVEVVEMKTEGELIRISANIYCEKASHKAIIIGKNGALLKKVGTYAREDLEKFFGKKIFLQLWVKVKDDWRNNNFMLKNLGFTEE